MLMHCTMQELLAIRDGEGSRAALQHLDDCEACRDELDRLHQRVAGLKALPALSPPRDRWEAVREEFVVARSKRRLGGWVALAGAASVALTFGIGQLVIPAAVTDDDPVSSLVTEAENLERELRQLEPELRVVNGRTAGALAALEDRLLFVERRFVDARNRPLPRDELILLLEERVRLMDALVNVRSSRGRGRLVGF